MQLDKIRPRAFVTIGVLVLISVAFGGWRINLRLHQPDIWSTPGPSIPVTLKAGETGFLYGGDLTITVSEIAPGGQISAIVGSPGFGENRSLSLAKVGQGVKRYEAAGVYQVLISRIGEADAQFQVQQLGGDVRTWGRNLQVRQVDSKRALSFFGGEITISLQASDGKLITAVIRSPNHDPRTLTERALGTYLNYSGTPSFHIRVVHLGPNLATFAVWREPTNDGGERRPKLGAEGRRR